jgi:hypothetical protein
LAAQLTFEAMIATPAAAMQVTVYTSIPCVLQSSLNDVFCSAAASLCTPSAHTQHLHTCWLTNPPLPTVPLALPTHTHLPDFIYADYLTANRRSEFQQLVWQIAQDYSKATLLLRLPGFVPMPAFQAIEDVPLVVRHARSFPGAVRTALNIPPEARVVILMHGGHNVVMTVREDFIPPGWVCVICNGGRPLSPEPLPPNFRLAPADAFTPDLVAASDCVLGKIGYGLVVTMPYNNMQRRVYVLVILCGLVCMHPQAHAVVLSPVSIQ